MVSKERKPYRTPDQIVADLEAKIASVRGRAERRKLNADPARRHAKLAAAALRRAVAASGDAKMKTALQEVSTALASCLDAESPLPAPMASTAGRRARRPRPSSSSA